ncbi:DUF3891 family protein [Pontibacillus sp. ALD_SL1]|uniref:DUF3891 family protein n=1 Tax=Pontibacillus sp. ALD_SL1 TaxID=2777185 RepID=UPI001A9697A1|nr:DUF3891 family protein [Pontibacillus sp. ALD_SL1]QST00097.1 DUF3891 family protein [Pontibacillus sp. ALD_SL1]
MIVVREPNHILLFQQHHHALVSGIMAKKWMGNEFVGGEPRSDVEYAVAYHDRAWIPLDQKPRWNNHKQQPYSFIDFPEEEKVIAYQRGIDEVEEHSSYAAVMCSMHYASFYSKADTLSESVREFLHNEERRRERLLSFLSEEADNLKEHLDFLQFCDDLSLYCCMNPPGVKKEDELSWFRDGFPQTFSIAPNGLEAAWVDGKHIAVKPFPFEGPFTVSIPYKRVSDSITAELWEDAYTSAECQVRTITFIEG